MNFADQEEIAERQKRRLRRQRRETTWNVLTALVLVAILLAGAYLVLLFSNPYTSLNPFPPPTMPVLVVLPSATPTPVKMPATWTPTTQPTFTQVLPTQTTTPVPTVSAIPTRDVTALPTDPNADYPFELKSNPIPMNSTVFHTDGDCNWQGIAGQVVDLQGRAVVGMLVRLTGTYNGKTVNMTTLTGGAQAWYGESGYEFVLGETPVDSTGLLSIQLTDQSFLPISDKVVFDTYASCEKNLILINFRQVR